MNCNDKKNEFPLLLDGTSQSGRLPFALDPNYVKVDERMEADWIVFARAYSKFIQFYDSNNQLDGDWSPFWTKNPAIVLANLAAARVDWFREEIQLITNEIQSLDNDGNDDLLRQNFSKYFDAIANLAWQLDQHSDGLPESLAVKTSIKNLIRVKLAPALASWIAWHKAASEALPLPFPLIDTGDTELLERIKVMQVLGEPLLPANLIWSVNDFSEDWIVDTSAADWTSYVSNILSDFSVLQGAISFNSVAEHTNFALGHTFFRNTFEAFLSGFSKIVQEARSALNSLLTQYNKHEPHFALFLAFLRLVKHEVGYLNGYTDRHLRFYYERVLRLKLKPPTPSKAYVYFELAKNVDSFLLKKGTLLKAGKDAVGNEMFFALDEDVVPNKAKVVEFKSILKIPEDVALYQSSDDQPAFKTIDQNRYFAAPVSNKGDGIESELLTANQEWYPFGNKEIDKNTNTWNVTIPTAEIGFAVASNYLYLTEGNRTITLTLTNAPEEALDGKVFIVLLTAEKGWHEVTGIMANNILTIVLDGAAPSIVPYDPKIHEGAYPTNLPILKAVLKNDLTDVYQYEALKNVNVTGVGLSVEVENKKTLALAGSSGPLDSSKPFFPFGAAPDKGAVFYVGDKEAFQKQSNITVNFNWIGEITGSAPDTSSYVLEKGNWEPEGSDEILPHSSASRSFTLELSTDQMIEPDFSPNEIYNTNKTAGFFKFELSNGFGHKDYPNLFAIHVASLAGDGEDCEMPATPFDPQVLECWLNYNATTSIPLNNETNYLNQSSRFFHLHPFGFKKVVPTSNPTSFLPEIVPQYNTITPNVGRDGGEWYIGIDGLTPPQNLTLLFQVLEGSANPLQEKPKPHVQWSYLIGNEWEPFNADEVRDGTNGLLQSGLITFSVPRKADIQHTILNTGIHWIRANVENAVDTVCQIINVHAQAASATLFDPGKELQIENLPIAANTIKKLNTAVSAIKKVHHPYATFGGRALEKSASFYTRISERLRHKNRGINLWDYERLVLEEFPATHKVKCLNHLEFQPLDDGFTYRELAPGHVTLIVIPNTAMQTNINPLRPYTSLGVLENIESFLRKRISCHVNLHIRNPRYETVLAKFKVRFFAGVDESFHERLLDKEIIQFLSPWAFSNTTEIGFGGKIYKSQLINFIEERPYVDYILDFELIHVTDSPQPDQEVIEPSSLVAILVSAEEHDITPINADQENEQLEDCRC